MSLTSRGNAYIARHLYHGERVCEPVAGPENLTDEHRQLYREQGFIAVANVFTAEEVAAAKAGLSHLIGGGNPAFTGVQFEEGVEVGAMSADEREQYVRKLMWMVEFEPRLKALSASPKLVGLAEWLIGGPTRMIQDMALLKPAHVGREKPWHQDCAYFMLGPMDLILGTWTALDEATLENGCMHVIPGSHREAARPHYHDRDCQLSDEDVAVERDVAVPLKPGGVLLFHGLTHHGTPPNQSATRRRAVQFHYASVTCQPTAPDEYAKFFHDARGMAACTGMKARAIADKF